MDKKSGVIHCGKENIVSASFTVKVITFLTTTLQDILLEQTAELIRILLIQILLFILN
jgi:hypothetical protein